MLSDFELQGLRLEKRKQERAKSPAVEIAMRLAKKNKTLQQLREELAPFIGNPKVPEIPAGEKIDPVKEVLKAGGFVAEED